MRCDIEDFLDKAIHIEGVLLSDSGELSCLLTELNAARKVIDTAPQAMAAETGSPEDIAFRDALAEYEKVLKI